MKYILLLLLPTLFLRGADVPVLNSNLEVVLPDGTVVGDIVTSTANTLQARTDGVKPLVSLVELKEAVRLHIEGLKKSHAETLASVTAEKTKAEATLKTVVESIKPAVSQLETAETEEGKSGRGEKFKRLGAIRKQVEAIVTTANTAADDKERVEVEAQIDVLKSKLKTLKKSAP